MALFQPTNIIPSSLIGQGTVDAKNTMGISWQVNGNSAMTAFQIDFYQNDTASTYVTSTGKITTGISANGFYGTDRFGKPQFFTYNANATWASKGFTNGNEYKFKITQFFNTSDAIYTLAPSADLSGNKVLQLKINTSNVDTYVVFDFGVIGYNSGIIFFNWTQQKGWIVNSNCIIPIPTQVSTEEPKVPVLGTGTLVTSENKYDFVTQNSFSTFTTRTTPTLTIYTSTSNQFTEQNAFPDENGNFASSIGYFNAQYQQDQEDAIRWIRWQVGQANNGVVGEILADTGDIYTPTLNFEFNGFFNGQQYAIRCFGESESGQPTQLQGANANGWVYFNIAITNQSEYTGNFTAQCLNKENAVLLEWEGVEVIPPTISPEEYTPTISNGSVTLNANSSVKWDKQGTSPMNFPASWTAVWKGKCLPLGDKITPTYLENINLSSQSSQNVTAVDFNPNGTLCVVGANGGYAYLYRVNATNFEYISEIKKNGSDLYIDTDFIRFSPNGNILLIGSNNHGIQVFSVNGETISYINDIQYNGSTVRCKDAVFNSSGSRLIVLKTGVGSTRPLILLYTVSGITITYSKTIYTVNNGFTGGTEDIEKLSISPKENILVGYGNNIYNSNRNTAIYFSINGDNYTYGGTINDASGISLGKPITSVAAASFSPDGTLLALCGSFSDAFNLYSVDNYRITFLKTLTRNGTVLTPSFSSACQFSQNGEALFYSGSPQFGTMELFLINGEGVEYNKSFGSYATVILLSPNSEILLSWSVGETTLNEYFINYVPQMPQSGKIFTLGTDITGTFGTNSVNVSLGASSVSFDIPSTSQELLLLITPNAVTAAFYNNVNAVISQTTKQVAYAQQDLTSVAVYGGDNGTVVNSVSVYQGDGGNILSLYQSNSDFEPVWNAEDYSLYMTANFNGNLEGGTGTANGSGFRIYRQEVGKTVLTPIATVSSTTTSVKDYGIVSGKAYQYSLYAYDNNGAFMSAVEAENTIATNFKNYSLLVCDYDQTNDEYHVRKQYLFALNLSDGGVGNNNSPTLNKNFTPYPTRMGDTANYKSGTLSGLIGAIYTIPALIEQIGQYKYTAKPSTMDYFDSVDLEQELYDLSVAPYQLFLRDMKGRRRMIATSAPITMTTNIKQRQQSITISLPWVEVGDASDVTIIQTPDDYGWDNDNQVLDVQLDVDVATGELSAQYPFPYNGTKFYLTGVNKETLTAKTPLGVTPAQFELSDKAEQPDDGELSATVKVNSEDNQ